jgi:very-short-patch-repair endonuclease
LSGTVLVLGVLLVLIAVAAIVLQKRLAPSPHGEEPWPFYRKKPLSEPEQILYYRLVNALPECIVLAQVQLSRILGVKKGRDFGRWHNRICQKSVDFVVCLKDSTVVAVVELDDATHGRASRQKADATKDKALASAEVDIVRWNVRSLPDEAEIRARFTT